MLLGSVLIIALYAARMLHTGRSAYDFLPWNTTLALVPWAFARASAAAAGRDRVGIAWLLAAGWIAFLPNAPYLVTDFVHLHPRPGAPLWYDIAMLGAAALTGLMAGALSLRSMQSWVSERYGGIAGIVLLVACVPATGVGIYLGRFERWNSWDLVLRPAGVLGDLAALAREPSASVRALVVCAVFSGLTAVAYLAVGGRISAGVKPRGARPTQPPTP